MKIKNTSHTVTVEPGKYWLGDPCYTVQDDLWVELLQSCDYFNQPIGTVNGFQVLAFQTKWGDGVYKGSDGHEYPVDAGLIGLVPVALAPDSPDGDRIVEFTRPTDCTDDDGVLTFGTITINTAKEDYDDDL